MGSRFDDLKGRAKAVGDLTKAVVDDIKDKVQRSDKRD